MAEQGKKRRKNDTTERAKMRRRWTGLETLEGRVMMTSAPVIVPGSMGVTPGSLLEGTTVATVSGSFTDVDVESHTASINWGDGNITAATIGAGGGTGTVTVRFDYSMDTNNFFDTQAKKDLLQSIADGIVAHFTDNLTAITPGGGNSWSQVINHPATGSTVMVSNPSVLANEIVIYAGGRDLPGSTLGIGGPGGFSGSGTQVFLDNITQRGQGTTQGAGATDFGPWGGSVTFDTVSTWWFGAAGDTSGLAGKNDFLSVATHEMVHALGLGTSDSWAHFRAMGNTVFTGPQSVAQFGSNVPLSGDAGHWAEATMSGGFETVMDPTITVGSRKTMTALDFAGLDDVGWDYVANPGTGTFTGTHTYADNGSYTISVVVSDPTLSSAPGTTGAIVTNVAPNLTISTLGAVNEGDSLSLTVNHTDPGIDTITSWNINWGDGNIQVFPGSNPTPTHIYANPGLFTISATATDEDGTFASNSIFQTVNNLAPSLTTISDLSGAFDNTDFTISYATLLAASNASDPAGGTLRFRVEAVNAGTLRKNGVLVTPGVTTLDVGESLAWRGAAGVTGLINAFSVRAFDGSLASTGPAVAVNINTTSSNHAPTLPVSPTFVLPTTNEDTPSSGTLVSAILAAAGAGDVDAGALSGIAIAAVTGAGVWQYSFDNFAWTTFPTVNSGASLLLGSTMRVRYSPDTRNGESATFTYRAWDQTAGTSGSTASTTSNGGATAFSTGTGQASIVVTSINDAPSLTTGPTFAMTGTNEETASPGTTVASLLAAFSATDVDTGATLGIAVTGTVGNGTWQYSTDNITWTAIGAVASTSALLLTPTSFVRYLPDARNAETATVTFRVWDQTTGLASINGFPSKISTNPSGTTTAFSIVTGQASVTVTAVNDAPILPAVGVPFALAPTNEDSPSSSAAVSAILAGVSYNDIDSGAINGIAITATTGNGVWQYSTDGSIWTTVGAVSSASALLLTSSSFVRYFPDLQTGETATFAFRAWDRTTGTASANNSPSKVNTDTNGGSTAFSIDRAEAAILVTDVNDAPTLPGAGLPFAMTATDESTASTGVLVSSIIATTFNDIDPGALSGLAVTAVTGQGVWQYSTDNNVWTAFGSVSDSASLLLNSTTFVRYVPDDRNGETATFTYRAWDQTAGLASSNNSPSKVNTFSRGGTTAISIATAQASITVADVNDAPTIPQTPPVITFTATDEDTTAASKLVSTLYASASAGDIDTGSPAGIAVTLAVGRGSWQYSTNGIDWTTFGPGPGSVQGVSTTTALLLDGASRLRYVPDGISGETASISFVAWDQAAGTASTFNTPRIGNSTLAGGVTAFSLNSASATLAVSDVNDAPTIAVPSVFNFPSTTDPVTPTDAVTVASLLAPSITDVDPGALKGLAVTSQTAVGNWQYSTNGVAWTSFGPVSDGSALLLSPATLVRFNPNGSQVETPTFTYRAWDQTAGSPSSDGIRQLRNTAGGGGTSAFSTQTSFASAVVTNANHAPSFTPGPNVTALEDAGARSITGWATAISAGTNSESGQILTFIVAGNDNPALFSAAPAVSANGTLTFTPAPDANGSAVITLLLQDSGGTADGGVDSTAPVTFTIQVTPVNDAPTIAVGEPPTILKNAGPQTIPGFATATIGPANEADQTITSYIVGNISNPALFAAAPVVAPNGTLTYTPASNAHGTATFTLRSRDSGGTANGGVDTSAPITVKIRIAQTFSKTVKLAALTDSNGTLVTFALSGNGTGQVLSDSDGSFVLTLSGTDAKSNLTVTTKKSTQPGDDGLAKLGKIQVNGTLGSFTAKTSDLADDFTATGSVNALTVRNITGGHTLTIGANPSPKVAFTLSAGRVTDTALTSAVPIKSITAFEWLDTATPETITASRIDALKITGDKKTVNVVGRFDVDLNVTGSTDPAKPTSLGATTVADAIGSSTWTVNGKAAALTAGLFDLGWHGNFSNTLASITTKIGQLTGTIDALSIAAITVKTSLNAAAIHVHQPVVGKLLGIGKLTVTGAITNSTILADGSIGAVTAGSITNSRLFAAYGNATAGLPVNLVDLGPGVATIASLTIKGFTGAAASNPSFTNSFVVASTISKVSLKVVDGTGPAKFGVAAHTLGTFTRTAGTPLPRPHTAPADYDTLGNFVVRVV